MTIKLVSYSQPTEEFKQHGITDAQELIAFCARVSNPSNQFNTATSDKLIRYLITHAHWSPLEMVNVCLEIDSTRDIARQLLRHRSFQFQEFCITGDSLITTVSPAGVPNYISIKKLYERQDWKNYKNLNIRVYDEENKEFVLAKFLEVFSTGCKPCYKVTLSDGKSINCTKEHKFLTHDGFETLEVLSGMTHHSSNLVSISKNAKLVAVNGEFSYQNKEWLCDKKRKSIENKSGLLGIAQDCGVSPHTIRKWLKKHNIQFTKKEVASYTKIWNKGKTGYTITPRTEEQRQHMRDITPKGENHHSYRGGNRLERKKIADYFNTHRSAIFRKFNFTCQHCKLPFQSITGKINIHHIKMVSEYPELAYDLNNVIPVHEKCHYEIHNKDYHKWFNSTPRKKSPKFVNIEKIEYIGEVDTYDLEVDHPSHNYVANKIVVHNSQRYADPVKDLGFVIREARLQDSKNRQNSIKIDMSNPDNRELVKIWNEKQHAVIAAAKDAYKWAIANDIAKEQARVVLPEGLMESKLYVNGTLRSWIHYIQVRSHISTQEEHRQLASACAKAISAIFPMVDEFVHKPVEPPKLSWFTRLFKK